MPFALSPGDSTNEIVDAINYLLGNFKGTVSANNDTGQVTGPTGEIVSYLYKYLAVKYADNYNGTLNFSDSPTNRMYYGLHNSDSSTETTNPADYVWYKVTGGFSTTKFFWYLVTGGRQIAIQIATTKPGDGYTQDSGSAINLDLVTSIALSPISWVLYRVPNNNSAPTNAESQTAIGRTPYVGDTCTINYNAGANSIQYKYDGTVWNVMNRYITGDIIKNLEGLDCAVSVVTRMDVNTGISNPSYLNGRIFYDSNKKTLAYYNDAVDNLVHIGQEVQVKVINNTGTTIPIGSPVYVTSTSSGQTYPNVALAKADAPATSVVLGLTTQAITNGSIGYVTTAGIVQPCNAGTFTVGQVLYLSPYSAGQLMNTIPPTGYAVKVGIVAYANTPNGAIYVRQTNAYVNSAQIVGSVSLTSQVSGTLPIANGGTGTTSTTFANLTTNVSGILPVANGGTGSGVAYTVATLPAAGVQGRRAWVTNALAPMFGAAPVGGGAVVIPVFDNGTAWIVG